MVSEIPLKVINRMHPQYNIASIYYLKDTFRMIIKV